MAIVEVAVLSFATFVYFEGRYRDDLRSDLFDMAEETQVQQTKSIAERLSSDLDSIRARLLVLANSPFYQDVDFTSSSSSEFTQELHDSMASVSSVDAVYVLDKDNKLAFTTAEDQRFIGFDFSSRDYVKEARSSLQTEFSNGFDAADGTYRITIAEPIVNIRTGEYVGLVGAGLIADPYFDRYGNIRDFDSAQYLNVLDKSGVFLASPNAEIIGRNVNDGEVQERWISHNPTLNGLYTRLVSAESVTAVFDVGFGERLTTDEPVVINGQATYFVTLGVPTALIYQSVERHRRLD